MHVALQEPAANVQTAMLRLCWRMLRSFLSDRLSARTRLDGARRPHWKPIRASRASFILKPRKTRNIRKGGKRQHNFNRILSRISSSPLFASRRFAMNVEPNSLAFVRPMRIVRALKGESPSSNRDSALVHIHCSSANSEHSQFNARMGWCMLLGS